MSALVKQISLRGPLWAVLTREFRTATINRFFQVFCGLALLGGISATLLSEDASAVAFFILQIALYFVSLFALMAGVSSAQGEREEWPLLLTQPLPRGAYVIGKFFSLASIFGAVLLLLFLPALITGAAATVVIPLYLQTLLLAAVFVAAGLAAGFIGHDRAQGLIVGVSGWLLFLFGIDLIGLFAARWSPIQSVPDLWVAALMLNPLDAFRIHALFALQQIPAEAGDKTPLAHWWIEHARDWFLCISIFWTAGFAWLGMLRLNRWEE